MVLPGEPQSAGQDILEEIIPFVRETDRADEKKCGQTTPSLELKSGWGLPISSLGEILCSPRYFFLTVQQIHIVRLNPDQLFWTCIASFCCASPK